MSRLRTIEIDGKRHLWRDILALRREQKKAQARTLPPTLFELRDDTKPASQRTAAGRYLQPTLFSR